jgi:hypothetical protein
VRDVEEAGFRPDRDVFLDDAGILDGHLPAPERDELAVESPVRFEQRCALEGGGF